MDTNSELIMTNAVSQLQSTATAGMETIEASLIVVICAVFGFVLLFVASKWMRKYIK